MPFCHLVHQTPPIRMATSCVIFPLAGFPPVAGAHRLAKEKIWNNDHQAGGGELICQLPGSVAISKA